VLYETPCGVERFKDEVIMTDHEALKGRGEEQDISMSEFMELLERLELDNVLELLYNELEEGEEQSSSKGEDGYHFGDGQSKEEQDDKNHQANTSNTCEYKFHVQRCSEDACSIELSKVEFSEYNTDGEEGDVEQRVDRFREGRNGTVIYLDSPPMTYKTEWIKHWEKTKQWIWAEPLCGEEPSEVQQEERK
jgi:hypothetical protein